MCVFRSLQAAALELERQKVSDSLKKGLEKRAEREDLIERENFFLPLLLLSIISYVLPPFNTHYVVK